MNGTGLCYLNTPVTVRVAGRMLVVKIKLLGVMVIKLKKVQRVVKIVMVHSAQ